MVSIHFAGFNRVGTIPVRNLPALTRWQGPPIVLPVIYLVAQGAIIRPPQGAEGFLRAAAHGGTPLWVHRGCFIIICFVMLMHWAIFLLCHGPGEAGEARMPEMCCSATQLPRARCLCLTLAPWCLLQCQSPWGQGDKLPLSWPESRRKGVVNVWSTETKTD